MEFKLRLRVAIFQTKIRLDKYLAVEADMFELYYSVIKHFKAKFFVFTVMTYIDINATSRTNK